LEPTRSATPQQPLTAQSSEAPLAKRVYSLTSDDEAEQSTSKRPRTDDTPGRVLLR
jgi:hypothetical protein